MISEFFEHLDWYRQEDCERLPQELALARRECPVVHSGYDGGQYVVTRYDDLRTVGEHPEIFSSSTPGVHHVPVPLPPLDLDPPSHRDFRQFLNPYFSRSFLQRYVPEMRRLADSLIDDVIDKGEVEFVSRFAIPFTAGSLARVVIDDDNETRMELAIHAVTAVATGDQTAYEKVAGVAAEILAERSASTVSVMGRTVTRDNELLGVPLKKGDRLAVHWYSGNRDETRFEHADELRFDRRKNPHIAFGVGIHRCVGQHFARLQIEVAVERLLRRLTNFSIVPGTTVTETAGVVLLAPAELHLSFDPLPDPAQL